MHTQQTWSHGLIFTCEHGGNRIPAAYQAYFKEHQALLNTHRGYDFGALTLAKELASAFSAPLVSATVSRLLVDLNRSIGNPTLHFDPIYALPESIREQILASYYHPYRQQTEQLISALANKHGQVLHISSHSFTPILNGEVRQADIGLLYDPESPNESRFCQQWEQALKTLASDLVIRHNYPYLGTNDGFPSWFRKQKSLRSYAGIELEINQKHIIKTGRKWSVLRKIIIESLNITFASQCLTHDNNLA